MKDFSAAQELFFQHDGSRFYMSRNDVEDVYAAYGVPTELEARWLEELTEQKLGLLQTPGNWRSIHFFVDQRDCRELTAVLHAKPLGVLWQRIAFVEEQLSYVEMCGGEGSDLSASRAGIRQVLANAHDLRRSCRSDRSRSRVDRLIAKARLANATLGADPGAPRP